MTRRQILFYTVLLSSILCSGTKSVQAADAPVYTPSCTPVYEEIVPLRVPDFDQAAMWKRTAGVQGIDRPRSLNKVADGGLIAIGESSRYDEKTGLAAPLVQMLRFDKTGKKQIETYTEIKNLDHVTDALLKKTSVVVLSSLSGGDMVLTYLNGLGEKKGEKLLHDPKRRLVPQSFISFKSSGFMVLASAQNRSEKSASYTALVRVNDDGQIVNVKEYLPGIKTVPSSIRKGSAGTLLVAGRVQTENEQDAGWLLKISTDGDLVFQRPYTRGSDATLRYAAATADGGVIAVGDAIPAGEGDKAAWILKTNGDGNVIWQKYLTGKYSYAAVDLVPLPDGRVMSVWAATPTTFGGRRFARVITVSNEGAILGDESFLEGSNAIPLRMVSGPDYRAILGMAETGFSQEKREDALQYVTYDSWMMALAPLAEFKNPCASAPDRKLDDLP